MKELSLFLVGSCLAFASAALPAGLQGVDPVKLAPDTYRVAIDNADVRVLAIDFKPGAKVPMHSHPASLLTAYTFCRMRFTFLNGQSADVEFKPGDIVWRDAETHSGENIGASNCHALQVEMKHSRSPKKKTK